MRQPPPTDVIRNPTPAPRDDMVALQRPTEEAEQEKRQHRQPKHHGKRPPKRLDLEHNPVELHAEVTRHERDRREENRNLSKQQRHPRQPLDA
jgi:hypothetical protein